MPLNFIAKATRVTILVCVSIGNFDNHTITNIINYFKWYYRWIVLKETILHSCPYIGDSLISKVGRVVNIKQFYRIFFQIMHILIVIPIFKVKQQIDLLAGALRGFWMIPRTSTKFYANKSRDSPFFKNQYLPDEAIRLIAKLIYLTMWNSTTWRKINCYNSRKC